MTHCGSNFRSFAISSWLTRVLGSVLAVLLILSHAAGAQTWTTLTNQPGVPVGTPMLLTDGTVMVQQMQTSGFATGNWLRLTPDITGSYANGTWSTLASMPSGYAPLFYASAVLPDGRVVVEGGEHNGNTSGAETNLGAIYNPATNSWTSISPPSGVSQIGDAPGVVLSNGTFMVGLCCFQTTAYLLNASNLTWTNTGSGKADSYTEEGLTLLPSGKVLTVDTQNGTNSELYNPSTGTWSTGGSTIVQLTDSASLEIGPAVLRPDGTVFATGGTSNTAIYNTSTGAWSVGPSFSSGLDIADGPAALLPSGNVLVDSSPGVFNNGTQFFEFNGTSLISVPAPANAANRTSFEGRMLVLPTGQILFTDQTSTVQIYTPSGAFQNAWRPTVSSVASTLSPGSANNSISGTQFNGLSQGAMYGDNAQMATNYPLVRITNNSTGHVFYAKTHNHSTMGVATGSATVSTQFDLPGNIEAGASTLVVVSNGIPSTGTSVTINGPPAPGTATVGVSGFLQSFYDPDTGAAACDEGIFYITVNGFTDSTPYSSAGGDPPTCDGVDPGFYAQYLANTINNDNPYVRAQWNGLYGDGASITLTAKTTGSNTNYPLSVSVYQYQQYHQDIYGNTVLDFSQPSYTLTPSGSTLTGGHN